MPKYTVEEFLEDCGALLGNRPTDYIVDGEEGSAFYAKIAQVGDHMKSKYPGDGESVFRASRFMHTLELIRDCGEPGLGSVISTTCHLVEGCR